MIEGVGCAVAGAALGWAAGWWIHPALGLAMAAVGLLNGAVSGARGIYTWRKPVGWLAFVLDSTWATLPVLSGLLAHLVALLRNGGYVPELSHRQGYHVYRAGAVPRKGYAMTLGNVVSGAADVERPRRAELVRDHEAVHVWQARWLGPLYLPLYGLWSALGALVGVPVWLLRGRRHPLGDVVEACSYYMNPFEWWAYSRDNAWRPHGMCEGVGWKRPMVESFAERRTRLQAEGRPPI